MSSKYYYITESGEKKKYVGNIIQNSDGTLCGMLTTEVRSKQTVDLTYHEEVKKVNGHGSYFTYMNDDGSTTRYYSFYKTDENGNPYFTYVTYMPIDLIYHPIVENPQEYYTYISATGEECLWTGAVKYDERRKSYIGKL